MNLDQVIDPDHALALMLAIAVLCIALASIITGRREERRRVTTSPSAEVDHTLAQAASEAQAPAAPTLRQLREASATRAQLARRSQDRSRERRAAHARERRSSSHEVQPVRRRSTWSESHEREAAAAATIVGNDVVAGRIIDLGVGRRALDRPRGIGA